MATQMRISSSHDHLWTPVPGCGPVPCDLMVIGDLSTRDDEKYGEPFAGKVGKELHRYMWHNSKRHRASYYVTNFIKHRVQDDKVGPTDADIAQSRKILQYEIRRINPTVIASIGSLTTRHFLGDVDMDCVHGVAHGFSPYTVVPCMHPAIGLHSTEFQAKIAWDFEQLSKVLQPNSYNDDTILWAKGDSFMMPHYREEPECFGLGNLVAMDTEGSVDAPWCLSVSNAAGTGMMLRTGQVKLNTNSNARVILHSALHDLPVLRAMGIRDFQFHDTMIMAYLLGVEPQGLKALAKRHCGMDMQDYQDLMGPANRNKAADYIFKVYKWLNKQYSSASTASSKTSRPKKQSTSASAGKRLSKTASRKK